MIAITGWIKAGAALFAWTVLGTASARQAGHGEAQDRRSPLVSHSALGVFDAHGESAPVGIGSEALIGELQVQERQKARTPPGFLDAAASSSSAPAHAGVEATSQDWLQVVGMAVNHYPSIASALATLGEQDELVKVARAGYMPQVQGSVTSGDQGEYDSGQVATIGVTQMLYDFGKVSGQVDRARAGVHREQAAVLRTIDEVVEKTAEALIEVHRNQELLVISHDRIEALRKVQDLTEMRADAGAATRSDPLQSRARVEAALARQASIEAELRQWRSRLATYVGQALPERVADAPAILQEAGTTTDDEQGIRRLPAILVAEAEREQARADLESARAQRYPTVSLDANMNKYIGTAGNRYQQIYGKDSYRTVFISVKGSMYQGGALAAQRRASLSALDAADAQLRTSRLAALDNLSGYRERIAGLQARIEVLGQRVGSITETRALYWDQYLSLGTRNVLDLLNAEQEIGDSAQDLVDARHDLWAARLNYLLGAGLARERFGLVNTRVQGMEMLP